MDTDDRLRQLAASCPYGLLTLPDAEAVGISRFAVADACRRAVLVRLAPGLYADAVATAPWLQTYAVPQRYLDAHRQRYARPTLPAALTAEGALDVRYGEPAADRALLMAVPVTRQLRLRTPLFDVIRLGWDEVEVEEVRGLRMTDAAQSLADAGHPGRLDDPGVRRVVDQARNRLFLRVPDLVTRWRALGTPGARRLLRMESLGVWEQESEGERRAFRELFEATHNIPDCQVVVHGAFRVDFVFLDAALIIEYDGRAAHERRWEADVTRRMALEQLGFRVVVVTHAMLDEAPRLGRWIRHERHHRLELVRRGLLDRPALPMQPPRMRPLRTLYAA